jgi:hypothetical protein
LGRLTEGTLAPRGNTPNRWQFAGVAPGTVVDRHYPLNLNQPVTAGKSNGSLESVNRRPELNPVCPRWSNND